MRAVVPEMMLSNTGCHTDPGPSTTSKEIYPMKIKLTLLALAAAGMWSTAPMAQPTHSPNPNKAQNSDMRTQSGMHPSAGMQTYVMPAESTTVIPVDTITVVPSESVQTMPSETVTILPAETSVTVVPARPIWVEPTVSRRSTGYGPTHTPNPNKYQNNGVKTQY